ncbi:MAG: SusC/RagA family TonB-linked outer membrane protein, partial [Muribaculaceae bacterium]|nr:SusC/RagA family TonB-linked outer membrane protein [Muribaculaceae bacterium]
IVITTKSGRTNKGIGVTVNSSITWEKAGWMPDLQGEYGPGTDLGAAPYSQWNITPANSPTGIRVTRNYSRYAFGEKFDASKMRYPYSSYNWADGTFTAKPWVYADDWFTGLFKTGVTYNNSVTVEGSNGKGTSARVSITDTRNEWILPNTGYKKDAVSVSFNTKLNKWISLSSRMNYYNKRADNIPMSGYSQNTPVYHAIWGITCNPFADYATEYFGGHINEETWENRYLVVPNSGVLGNPLRYLYEETNSIDKNRMVGNVNMKIKLPVKGLTLNLRAAVDMNDEFRTMRKSRWSSGYPNGGYKEQSIRKNETNLDFLLRYENNKWFNKRLSFNVSGGGNTMTNKYYTENIHLKDLEIPGIYNVTNAPATSIPVPYHYRSKKVVNSFYAFASLGWDNTYFLDITGRNDWSSTLARGNWSFFYPSVAASVLLDQAFRMQEHGAQWIDMLKLRLSWANVGNDTSPYALVDAYSTSSFTGGYTVPTTMSSLTIKPENVESWEAGLEMRFLQNRIGFDAAVYSSSTTDQIVSAKVEPMTGANGVKINAGEIRNRGIELSAHFVPVRTRDFEWTIDANWSKNWNKLVSLQGDWDPTQPLETNMGTTIGGRVYCYSYVGEEMNKLYGKGYVRATNGFIVDADGNKIPAAGQKIITESNGLPQLTSETSVALGKVNPDWNAGLSTRFRYKQFSLSANFTAQVGGHAYSVTNFALAYQGKTKSTLPGRQGGYVVEGVNLVGYEGEGDNRVPIYKKNTTVVDNIQQYYSLYVYNRDNAEENTFKTDFLKLKELRLDYALPKS